jgi:hypothetical protein
VQLLQDKIKDNQHDLSTMIPALAAMAAELVRDLDPQVCILALFVRWKIRIAASDISQQ